MNERLEKLTGWRVVGVPGLIPDEVFYDHLAHRRFPVTCGSARAPRSTISSNPTCSTISSGTFPLLSNPVFADYMQMYGQRGIEAGASIDRLARLYGYRGVGLIRTAKGLKIYGAGILSSAAEIKHAIGSKDVERLPFEAATVMHRPYEIDKLQNSISSSTISASSSRPHRPASPSASAPPGRQRRQRLRSSRFTSRGLISASDTSAKALFAPESRRLRSPWRVR